jgi:phosphoribosylformylglycinamidine cyclo-ligase
MPGFYAAGEYDVAGFIVGGVSRSRIIDGRTIERDDVLIGLPSTGLHTNGYSLARRIVFEVLGLGVDDVVPELGEPVGAALTRTHRSYLPAIGPLLDRGWIKGMAHITGGGLTENTPRMLPEGRSFLLDRDSWAIPPLFRWLGEAGHLDEAEMFRAFNMGVGLVIACAPAHRDAVLSELAGAWVLGRVT